MEDAEVLEPGKWRLAEAKAELNMLSDDGDYESMAAQRLRDEIDSLEEIERTEPDRL